jgi:LacI family transcriptional regulator
VAIRLKDIARDVGVSVITVSKVLRNHPDIGEQTRERVLQRVRELNYQPNVAARALVTGRSYSVGLVAPDLVHAFFSELAKGLSGILRDRGYGLLISSTQEDPELERMLARRVDALVLASSQCNGGFLREFAQRDVRLILVDRKFDGVAFPFVGIDDERAGELATQHLIDVGCERIAHILGPEISTAEGRLAGYREALARAGRPIRGSFIVREPSSDDSGEICGYHAMRKLLKLDPRPDGVFCFNDPMAMGAMRAILEAGLRIPEDIAVIGCGNLMYAPYLRVPLSSIDQDRVAMGARAGELALSMIEAPKREGKRSTPQQVLMDTMLVARESTARIE